MNHCGGRRRFQISGDNIFGSLLGKRWAKDLIKLFQTGNEVGHRRGAFSSHVMIIGRTFWDGARVRSEQGNRKFNIIGGRIIVARRRLIFLQLADSVVQPRLLPSLEPQMREESVVHHAELNTAKRQMKNYT